MPELPEVETVMRGLRQRLQGRMLLRAVARRPDMRWPLPPGLAATLTGARVTSFRRRAKYILMRLDNGWSVLLHLGMSGRMLLEPVGHPGGRPGGGPEGRNAITLHEHLELETDDGWRVGFVDPRRFGSVDLVETEREDRHRLLAGLGPEPLDETFSPAVLATALSGKKTPIKAALLDQKIVAGLGNIYVCEALFRAAISPQRLAHTVPGARTQRLVPAIKQTLTEAITAGGSSLRDYVQTNGELGYFQHTFRVYGREGEPCPGCPGIASRGGPADPFCPGVRRIVQSGRSTFYCPRTQR
ncbi:bifunctional DNA-formamidopyrimidine glycosylase/DNA-(apurinic or apyrimidinic site) lyase [Rhodopila sp.]|uniref:bifunctional DNA-formamidopyrimidine glycosylase/DNA-(apurinic or apyrimidinic site) lyase n=1 Tax=Rhodopila sp. TaxID=2480087 RepID=UPI003D0E683A